MPITILDGSIGQELVNRSKQTPTGLWSTRTMIEMPELVEQLHRDYFAAGAEVATTNTYALHHDRLRRHGLEGEFERLHRQACQLAVDARNAHGGGMVAGSMGPTGWSYRPDLAPPADEAAELYAEIAAIQSDYVDLLILETMASVDQARGALMGARVGGKPIWLAVSVDDQDGTRLRSLEPVSEILPLVEEFEPAALLLNCSMPEAISQAMPLLTSAGVPIGAYANGFTGIVAEFKKADSSVDALAARTDLGPESYADFADEWINLGATIVGGCCEVGPAHIREIVARHG